MVRACGSGRHGRTSPVGKSCSLKTMAALRKGTGAQPQACDHTLCRAGSKTWGRGGAVLRGN